MYRINVGDTLSGLARRFKTTVQSLVRANPKITNPDLILSGDSLQIPGSSGKSDFTAAAAGAPNSGPAAQAALGNVPDGKVGDWIRQAMTVLQQHGVPVEKMNPADIAKIIQHESGGNPNAYNGWDSNAAKGTPSIGLMQTIGPTFNAYKLPGHDNIRDPVANIIAGVRYAISRYGSVSNVPGIVGLRNGTGYRGY